MSIRAAWSSLLSDVSLVKACGFTPQSEGLETLYKKYKDQGFVVLGFPCNQFGGQEPGSESDIFWARYLYVTLNPINRSGVQPGRTIIFILFPVTYLVREWQFWGQIFHLACSHDGLQVTRPQIPRNHLIADLATKPSIPKARTKKSTKVPNLPAFDCFARSQTMNSMYMINKPSPQVKPTCEICASVSPNTIQSSCARDGSWLVSTKSR